MNSLKGTSHPSSMSSFLLVFIIYIPNHTAVFQALCWALMDIIPNPQKTFTLGVFLPILQKWQQLSDYSRTPHIKYCIFAGAISIKDQVQENTETQKCHGLHLAPV